MKIDIWSDIMCPFCYIGKRHMEAALKNLDSSVEVKIVWHSFQLDPDIESQPGVDVYTYLAERKGWSLEYTRQAHERLVQWAKLVGLDYRFDKAVVANSFKAHRLIQMAKEHGLSDLVEEKLFHAYFTDGKNVDDTETLAEIGNQIGLSKNEVIGMFGTDRYSEEVHRDVKLASSIGVRGVPFFLVDGKYAISGAQPVEVFSETFEKVLSGNF